MFTETNIELFESANYQFPVLFEIIPPERGKKEERLRQHTEYLDYLFSELEVDALNLPEIQNESQKGEGGKRRNPHKERISPRSYVECLSETFDTEFVVNRVIVKHPYEEQEKWLLETHDKFDIKNIILVGGESSRIHYPGPSVPDGNRLVKHYLNQGEAKYTDNEINPVNLTIGNICIPTRRNKKFDEPERMLKKVEAGADFFTSQIIAEARTPVALVKDFSKLCALNDSKLPLIVWSFSPIAAKKDVDFLRWLGVYIPEKVEKNILKSNDPVSVSIDWARKIWSNILDANSQLPRPLPMGINISVMGLRNFKNGVRLAKSLTEIEIPELHGNRISSFETSELA